MYARQGAGYFHDMLVRLFDEAGVMPDYVQHVTQIHSMLGLVRRTRRRDRAAIGIRTAFRWTCISAN